MKRHCWNIAHSLVLVSVVVLAVACSTGHHGHVHHPAPPVEVIVEAGPDFPVVDIEAEIVDDRAEAERLDQSTAKLTTVLGAGVVGAVIGGLAGLSKDCDGDRRSCRRQKADAVDAVTGSVVGASIGALIGWGLYELSEE